eukprot:4208240-Pyramimonas_sp.AAC.1
MVVGTSWRRDVCVSGWVAMRLLYTGAGPTSGWVAMRLLHTGAGPTSGWVAMRLLYTGAGIPRCGDGSLFENPAPEGLAASDRWTWGVWCADNSDDIGSH